MSDDGHLNGKVALVTGSTSGIGLGIARALAGAGADIVLNGLGDPVVIDRLRADLAAEFDVEVRFHGADMTKEEEIAAMIASVEAEFGAVDVLVNNAGMQFVAPIDEFPVDKWNQIIALNLSATFHAIRLALPAMKKKGWGRILSTASAHALVASPYKVAYVAAKHGIAGVTRTVALETAEHGITVNAICPGYVWTPLVEKQIPATAVARGLTEEQVKKDVILAAQPTKEFVKVEEVAALALFLTTDAARSITGSLQSIDGGWTAA
jgi:3-hydroxybutyrate dehydrogenase